MIASCYGDGSTSHLTHDLYLDFQSTMSCGHDPYVAQKIRVLGQSVQKLEWKQSSGQR